MDSCISISQDSFIHIYIFGVEEDLLLVRSSMRRTLPLRSTSCCAAVGAAFSFDAGSAAKPTVLEDRVVMRVVEVEVDGFESSSVCIAKKERKDTVSQYGCLSVCVCDHDKDR